MIALAPDPDGAHLRVAFADPTDEDAQRAVRELTGLRITPVVATVTAIRTAIDREYARRTTRVIRTESKAAMPGTSGSGSDLPPLPREITERVGNPVGRGRFPSQDPATEPALSLGTVHTAPVHRLEDDATIEQRHEALLLALIEAGVITRADYAAALRRLLGR